MYVNHIFDNSGAEKAGLKKGDFITAVNGAEVNSSPELLEQIALYKPGDNVSITATRNGKLINTVVQLKNIDGNTDIVVDNSKAIVHGAKLRTLTPGERNEYNLSGGVLVTDIEEGIIQEQTKMKPGFVITKINNEPISTIEDFQSYIGSSSGNIKITGMYPGKNGMFFYGLKVN